MQWKAGQGWRIEQDKRKIKIEVGEEIELTTSRHANPEGEIGLEKILKELRKEKNKEKLVDIKEDLNSTNKRIEEAEDRITEAEE